MFWSVTLIKDKNDEITGTISITRDITELKMAEYNLRESENRYKYMFENNPLPMWVYDLETLSFLMVNEAAVDKYGYSKDEFINMTLEDIRPAEDVNILQKDIESTTRNLNYAGVWRHKKKNGEIVYVEIISHKIKYEEREARLVLAKDITEQKRAQVKFQEIWHSAEDGMRLTDADGIVRDVNPSYCKLVGKKRNELVDRPISVIYKGNREHILKKHQERFRNHTIKPILEGQFTLHTGEVRWFEVNNNYGDIPGEPEQVLAVFRDITERKAAEKALQESEEKFREIFNNANDAIYLHKIDEKGMPHKFIEVNDVACRVLGYTKEEFYSMAPTDIDGAHMGSKVPDIMKNLLKEESITFEIDHRTKSGKLIPVEINSHLFEVNGEKRVLSVARDITERKIAEKEIKLLSRSIEQSPISVMITDPEGTIEYVNPRFTEVTGYSEEEIKGANPRVLKSGRQSKEFYENLWGTILSGNDWQGEIQNKKKNGELFWENTLISPIINAEGDITHFVAVMEDITEEKRIWNELVEAKEKAEEMNEVKSFFFANMSHELRTPMWGISGYAELLKEALEGTEEEVLAQGIIDSSDRLTETLTNILNITKLELEQTNVNYKQVDLADLIDQVHKEYSLSADKKNISLYKNIKLENSSIYTDENLMRGILNNLVSNSIKYTEECWIEVSADNEETNGDKRIRIQIRDTGVGISKDRQEIIWEPFRQASEGRTREFQGTGLGLPICKKYVELLGGSVWLESEVGKGTIFTVELPANV